MVKYKLFSLKYSFLRGGIALLLLTLQVFIFPVHAFAQEVSIPDVQSLRDEIRAQADQLRAEVRGQTNPSTPQSTEPTESSQQNQTPEQNSSNPNPTQEGQSEALATVSLAVQRVWIRDGSGIEKTTFTPGEPIQIVAEINSSRYVSSVSGVGASVVSSFFNISNPEEIPAGISTLTWDTNAPSELGNYTVRVELYAGFGSSVVSSGNTNLTVTTTPTTAPTVNITASPNTHEITADTTFTFTANPEPEGAWGNDIEYNWSISEEKCVTAGITYPGQTFSRTLGPECGNTTISLTASDERGNSASDTYSVTVRESTTPSPTEPPTQPTPISNYNITGTVFVDTEDEEQGYSGATITLDNGQSTTTDKDGNYTFTNLPSGHYVETLAVPLGYSSATQSIVAITLNGDVTQNFEIMPNFTQRDALQIRKLALAIPCLIAVYLAGGALPLSCNDTIGELGIEGPALVACVTRYGLATCLRPAYL